MYAEVAWVLVSLGTQIQPHIALKPDYFSHYSILSQVYLEECKHKIKKINIVKFTDSDLCLIDSDYFMILLILMILMTLMILMMNIYISFDLINILCKKKKKIIRQNFYLSQDFFYAVVYI